MPDNGVTLKPFLSNSWKGEKLQAAQVLWSWHDHLGRVNAGAPTPEELTALFEQEANRVDQHEALTILPNPVWRDVYQVCERFEIPTHLLSTQLRAAQAFCGPIQFKDTKAYNDFLSQWAIPHAHALAHLGGAAHRWQLRPVGELARAFFIVNKLVELPRHTRKGWFFLPNSDLEQAGVTHEELADGEVSEKLGRLLWKQCVRARDAFAQGIGLQSELERAQRKELKQTWLMGLEILNEIERRKYDLWSGPIQLSGLHRLQVRIQSIIGKGFKRTG